MIVEPYGGISNRLKCIISSIAEYGDITLKWDIPNNGGGVRCDFNDLFTNNFNQSKSYISSFSLFGKYMDISSYLMLSMKYNKLNF